MPGPAFAYGGPGGDATQLNAPPPNPAQPLAPSAGMQGQVAGLAGQVMPAGLIPPEILGGMMNEATKIDQTLDSFAQITPDLAMEWLQIKDLLQRAMGKLLVAGAPASSPTAPGAGFAGGGMDRGGMPM